MLKRKVSLILFVTIFFSLFTSVPSYGSENVDISLLSQLGIISEEKVFTSVVTKGEFYEVVSKISKSDQLLDKEDSTYNYPVLWKDAIYEMVNLLGYKSVIKNNLDYLNYANKAGILKGLTYKGLIPITFGEFVNLTMKTLQSNLFEQVEFGDEIIYETNKSENLLSLNFDVHKDKGIVTGINTTFLGVGTKTLLDNEILIGETKYNHTGLNVQDYLGYNVTLWYRQRKDDDKKEIFLLEKSNNKDLVIYDHNMGKNSTKNNCTYIVNEKSNTVKISETADLVYNFKNIAFDNTTPLYVKDSIITFIDNNNDSIYDVAIISSYVNYYVDSVNAKDMIIKESYGQNTLNLESTQILEIYKDNKRVAFSEIKKGNMLSIVGNKELLQGGYKTISPDCDIVKIFINSDKVSGYIDSYTAKSVVIDSTEYELSHSLIKAVSNKSIDSLENANVDLYLDITKKVMAYNKKDDNTVKYGYLIGYSCKDNSFDDLIKVKVLEKSGLVSVFSLKNKIQLDGNNTANTTEITECLKNSVGVIKYKTNEKGEIVYVDTPYYNETLENEKSSLNEFYKSNGTPLYYSKTAGKSFVGKVILGDSPSVFVVPPVGKVNDDSDYYVADENYFGTSGDFIIDAYDGDVRISDIIVTYVGNNFQTTSSIMLVQSVNLGVNENRENIHILNGYVDGKKVKFQTKKDNTDIYDGTSKTPSTTLNIKDLKLGDIIRLSTDKNDNITAVQFIFSSTTSPTYGASTANYDASFRLVYAKAYEVKNKALELSIDGSLDKDSTETFILSNTPIYEIQNNKIKVSSIENIYTYHPTKDLGTLDNVALFSSRSNAKIAVIVR